MAGYPPNGNQPPQQPGAYPPQQPPPGAPAPYGHGGMQGGGHLKPHRGTLVIVLAILGWALCFICGIVAFFMSRADLKEMQAGVMDRSGEGLTNAARIISMVQLILAAIFIPLYIIFIVVMVSSDGMQGM
ncbi:MAG: hypothetical protein L3J82_03725 [Planctomycetes bacterium]|nr:hypothetical protein [Planctomycetota bacterium]